MKHSLLFPLIIMSLTLTSCTLLQSADPDVTPPEETPVTIAPQEENPPTPNIFVFGSDEAEKSGQVLAPQQKAMKESMITKTDKNTVTPPPKDDTPKSEEVSTEELTKELDAFVDDITKGL